MGNKSILIVAIILLVVAIAGGSFLWWSMKSEAPSVESSPTPTPIVSPGITLEVTPTPEETPAEETEEKSALEQIREAFAEKYDKLFEEVVVNISENTGTHASGGVSFAGEMGGGMWLAYKDGNEWKITYDGHGTISCSAVDPYDFPADMVPECWDEATDTLIQR